MPVALQCSQKYVNASDGNGHTACSLYLMLNVKLNQLFCFFGFFSFCCVLLNWISCPGNWKYEISTLFKLKTVLFESWRSSVNTDMTSIWLSRCLRPRLPLSFRNLRSGLRILPGESTWCSWAEPCWPTSWRTRTTSGWPGRSTRRKESVCWKNSESPSDKALNGQTTHTHIQIHTHTQHAHVSPLAHIAEYISIYPSSSSLFDSWYTSNTWGNRVTTFLLSSSSSLLLFSPGLGFGSSFSSQALISTETSLR